LGWDFPHLSRPTQPPIQWVPGFFPGVKRPGRGVDHPPQSSAEVKERAVVYLYSPSGPSWPILGLTLPILDVRQTNLREFLHKHRQFHHRFHYTQPDVCYWTL